MPNPRARSKHRETPAVVAESSLHARKQQLVRDAIWDAAIDLFADKGFDETTVEHITNAAGVSQRSFFRYFASKADLMGQSALGLGSALSGAIAACPATYPPSQVMREAVGDVVRRAARYPRTEKIVEIASKYPSARQAQMSRMAEIQGEVVRAYAHRSKHLRKGDITPRVLAAATIALFELSLHAWLEKGRQDIDGTVDEVFETLREVLA